MNAQSSPGLDLALALRQIGETFVHDSTPILAQGAVLLTLPALLGRVLIPGHSAGTVLAVVAGLGAALFAVLVSYGTLARLAGRPLALPDYFRRAVVASPPGFNVALLLGAAAVAAAIVPLGFKVAADMSGAIGAGLALGALVLAGIVIVLPAVPLALAERCRPVAALQRAAVLTRGNRGRIVALLVIAALTFGPAALLIDRLGGDSAETLASGHLWLSLLFDLLAASLLATVPAVVYAQLARRA